MKHIILHIDSLVLKGFRQQDGHGIAKGLQHELARLFAAPQAAQQLTASADMSRLQVGSVAIAQGTKPQRIGMRIAHGISKGMKS